MSDETKQRLYAFWGYDRFPYCLGGEVDYLLENGRVQVKNYGGGIFRYSDIMPYEEGAAKHEELEKLESEYHAAKDKLHAEFMARRLKILPAKEK